MSDIWQYGENNKMFIEQLPLTSDSAEILAAATELTTQHHEIWAKMHQLCLTHKSDSTDIWLDGTGSLVDRATMTRRAEEWDFNLWNIDPTNPIRQQIELLSAHLDNIKFGRIRIMRLLPKTGLSVHKDKELRYHLVLKTNPRAYIAHETADLDPARSTLPTTAACYHLPNNNHWFRIDTRETHWVYNGGNEERIHLVVCGI
jgi:hypothetical protein